MSIKAMYAYNNLSEGAKALCRELGIKRIAHKTESTFVSRPDKTIINWGASELPPALLTNRVLNRPEAVARCISKVDSFRTLETSGVVVPPWTTDQTVVQNWLRDDFTVFARTLTRASSGRGIVIMEPDHPDNHNTSAPLYTRYVKKLHEYRVHIMNGVVIDTQRKGLREELRGRPDVDFRVRNLNNGFVFVRNDGHVVPEEVTNMALLAVATMGLDFGAVDVIWNNRERQAYVLEVNTAPGLSGTTLTNYATAFATNY
jgi:hypothetical protein